MIFQVEKDDDGTSETTAQMDMEAGAIRQKLTFKLINMPKCTKVLGGQEYGVEVVTDGSQSNVVVNGFIALKQTGTSGHCIF